MLNRDVVFAIAKIILGLNLDRDIDVNSLDFRIIIQKVGYILQRMGCDTGLKFSWYSLGPYSRSLQNYYSIIIDTLMHLRQNTNNDKISEDVIICIEKTISFLRDFSKVIGDIDAKSLEILASLAMLCTEIYPKPYNVVEELLNRKKGLSKDLVEDIWKFLVDKNICVV